MRAKETKSCVGGDCCVPIAVRKNARTIRILAKLVAIKIKEGAKTSSVKIATMFRVETKSPGSVGALSVRSTVGIVGLWGNCGGAAKRKSVPQRKTRRNRNTRIAPLKALIVN